MVVGSKGVEAGEKKAGLKFQNLKDGFICFFLHLSSWRMI